MAADIWYSDPKHSDLKFKLRHLIVTEISGHVRQWQGMLRLDPENPAASAVEAVLFAGSIDTGDPERDDHIRSAEFLNVAAFPEMRFRSRAVSAVDEKNYRVQGELTVRGVTRAVTLEVEDLGRKAGDAGRLEATFKGRATINRQDFGLHWNQDLDSGGIVLGDKIEVQIMVEAVPGDAAAGLTWHLPSQAAAAPTPARPHRH